MKWEKQPERVARQFSVIWLARLSDELLDMVDKKKSVWYRVLTYPFLTEQGQEWVQGILKKRQMHIDFPIIKVKRIWENGELTFCQW